MKVTPASSYAEKLRDPRWQKKRLEILERDGWACQLCGSTSKTLHVHHIAYCPWERVEPWDDPSSMLVTACYECHEAEHQRHKHEVYALLVQLAEIGIRTSTDLVYLRAHADLNELADDPVKALAKAVAELPERRAAALASGDWYLLRND